MKTFLILMLTLFSHLLLAETALPFPLTIDNSGALMCPAEAPTTCEANCSLDSDRNDANLCVDGMCSTVV